MIITPAQTCGPLFGFAMTPSEVVSSAREDEPDAVVIEGKIFDGNGQDLGYGAFVELWSAEQSARVRTLDGKFRTVMRRPRQMEVGGAEKLAPHFDIRIVMRGLAMPLVTKMYFPDQLAANDRDPLLNLLPEEERNRIIAQPGGDEKHFHFDIHLQGPRETFFFTADF
ncbi:peptidase associated/transthyretin-like domain-containing protein [Corynebacterium comes]|uniref:Protocatechuate 3,4-dioxygenase alpha chain n=1 Tax=Corynebacterium comes TaxID=2675218 RepID=A0A6B8VS36_9CORY|nr:hypothetical protein [Corynebacterium comes]QGU05879.1 Protocatechuate 3,4-dioxygenase alpha chain [Corynebacterium comes]